MNAHFIKLGLFLSLFSIVFSPTAVLAAPLTGADADVVYMHKGMIGDYTDDTTNANDSDSAGDVMWPSSSTKVAFVGHQTSQFGTVVVDVATAIGGLPGEPYWYYWNGSAWTQLTITTSTTPFYATGVQSFSFTVPTDWVTTTVNGVDAYWTSSAQGYVATDNTSGAWISQISVLLEAAPAATPEFTDVLYIGTLALCGWFVMQKYSKQTV